jgi:hypothetical protein
MTFSGLMRIAAFALPLLLAGCAANPVTGNPNFVTMSEAQEIHVGKTEDSAVRKEYGVYDDPALQQYVNEVGQRLARRMIPCQSGLYSRRAGICRQQAKCDNRPRQMPTIPANLGAAANSARMPRT